MWLLLYGLVCRISIDWSQESLRFLNIYLWPNIGRKIVLMNKILQTDWITYTGTLAPVVPNIMCRKTWKNWSRMFTKKSPYTMALNNTCQDSCHVLYTRTTLRDSILCRHTDSDCDFGNLEKVFLFNGVFCTMSTWRETGRSSLTFTYYLHMLAWLCELNKCIYLLSVLIRKSMQFVISYQWFRVAKLFQILLVLYIHFYMYLHMYENTLDNI